MRVSLLLFIGNKREADCQERPCTRCEKKGIADQCVEGVRKKAKYLMEGEMEEMSGMSYPPRYK
jgi:hypothetical protein